MVELEDGMKVKEKNVVHKQATKTHRGTKNTHLDKQTSVRRYEDDVTMNAGGRFGSLVTFILLLYLLVTKKITPVHCLDFKF